MALINCPECGKQISEKAEFCLGGSYPIKNMFDGRTYKEISEEFEIKYSTLYKYKG